MHQLLRHGLRGRKILLHFERGEPGNRTANHILDALGRSGCTQLAARKEKQAMSQEELVDAYLKGRISRRTFIRRMTIGGVSLGAAVAYSGALGPLARGGRLGGGERSGRGFYEFYERIHERVNLQGRIIENPFTKERLVLSGFAELISTIVNVKGKFRVDFHFNYAGATATSKNTGEVYRVTGGQESREIANPQGIIRFNETLHLISQGPGPNLLIKAVGGIKVIRKHEVVVEFEHFIVQKRG